MNVEARIRAIHPGEILLAEFIEPMGLSQNKIATEINVPARRINEIVLGKRGITTDTALRLGKFFGTTPQFWLNLQNNYELRIVEKAKAKEFNSIHKFESAAIHS